MHSGRKSRKGENERMSRFTRGIFAVAFLLVVATLFVALLSSIISAVDLGSDQKGKARIRKRVKDAAAENFPLKPGLVDLNGGVCRAVGRRLCNENILCRNGVTVKSYWNPPVDDKVDGCRYVRELSAFCKDYGISFLFVAAPAKIDNAMQMYPDGWNSCGNFNSWAHACCEKFKREGIDVVDLTSKYTADPEMVRRNFFKSDHHWRVPTAFDAARTVVGRLSVMLSDANVTDHPFIDPEKWQWYVLKECYVGSHGGRTGRFFTGVDDFEYAVPKFKTQMSKTFFRNSIVRSGSFEDTIIEKSGIKRGGYTGRYRIFGGGDDEWQSLQHTLKDRRMLTVNEGAPCDKRIFISRDSFGIPFAAVLSVLFKEVYICDPRNLPPSLGERDVIKEYRPDVVVRICYPPSLKVMPRGWTAGEKREKQKKY